MSQSTPFPPFAPPWRRSPPAGRTEHPIPCYANCRLKQHPWYAGSYPSGGPVKGMHPIWKVATPSLFAIGPDIYVPYAADILDEYACEGSPLVIPEVRKDAVTSSYCLYAFGKHNAVSWSPFGIEDLALPTEAVYKPLMEVMTVLNIAPQPLRSRAVTTIRPEPTASSGRWSPSIWYTGAKSASRAMCAGVKPTTAPCSIFEKYDLAVAYSPA